MLAAGAAILLYMTATSQLRNTQGSDGTATPYKPIVERRPLTSILGVTIPGKTPWRLGDFRGKVVLVNYAATWCGPCRRETPDLVRTANQFKDRDVVFFALMMDEGSDVAFNTAVAQYAHEYAISYTMIRPEADPLLQFSGMGLPTSLLLDRKGRLVKTYIGPISPDTLTDDIARVLGES